MKVKIEVFEGKATALWAYDGPYWELGIKGCPMGRGSDGNKALLNLLTRTNMESGTNFTVSDVKETDYRRY